jgi:hypothetical protein
MSYLPCLGCGKLRGCVCNTPIRTLPHLQPATTQTVVPVDEKRLRAERRERIATACLASLLTHDGWEYFTPNHAAKDAIRYADALIEEIDKEAKP